MSALTIIFITVIICAELDFFAILYCKEISEYCKEISEWLKAKSEEIRTRAENLKNANPAYNAGYSSGYTDGKIDGMKAFAYGDPTDTEIYKPEGTE